jgi:hypothetical protein
VNQISFKLPTLADLKSKHAEAVALGMKDSIYFADPEGNRVELFADTPWHMPQPFAEPFDIEAPAEQIFEQTEKICRSRPGFISRADWRKAQVDRLVTAG